MKPLRIVFQFSLSPLPFAHYIIILILFKLASNQNVGFQNRPCIRRVTFVHNVTSQPSSLRFGRSILFFTAILIPSSLHS
ncbi:hypothetical protein CW304_20525 [Bacillus sp. UFRGS-B20]|nr:hypothetical protein CW304_20525 [Bacillus sp. UFRGS-B20]